jgi:hypothetical protein
MASSTQQQDKPAITAKVLADKLGTQPRELRKFIRTLDLGVGRGARYAWPAMSDPAVKKITAAWRKAHADAKEA